MARPRSDIQDRILAAAQARFLAEGVEATSLRNIAKDADTSIGMVYYYYPTKDDLFLALVEEPYQAFLRDLEEVLASKRTYQERICGFYARIGAMSQAEWETVRLIVRESLTSNERRDRLKRRFLRGHLPLLMRAILEAAASNETDKQIHPIVVMACTLGFGGAAAMLMQLVRQNVEQCANACVEPEAVPDFLRETLRDFTARLPNSIEIAKLLSSIVTRATGSR